MDDLFYDVCDRDSVWYFGEEIIDLSETEPDESVLESITERIVTLWF